MKRLILIAIFFLVGCVTTPPNEDPKEPIIAYHFFNVEEFLELADDKEAFLYTKKHSMDLRICRNESNLIPVPTQMPQKMICPPGSSFACSYEAGRGNSLSMAIFSAEYNKAQKARSEAFTLCMEQKNYISLSVDEIEKYYPEILEIWAKYYTQPLPRYWD